MMPQHPRTVMGGSYATIAAALPEKGSIVFVSGVDDADRLFDTILPLRGTPLDLDCKVQIADSRSIRRLIFEANEHPALFITDHLLSILPTSVAAGNERFAFAPVSPDDRMVDRIPEGGAVLIVSDVARVVPLSVRIVQRRGQDLSHKVFVLVSHDPIQEARDLGATTLPVFYDPAFPQDRIRTRIEPLDNPGAGPDALKLPVSAARSPAQVAADRYALIWAYEAKIRRAEYLARRTVGKATLDAFVAMLPCRPHYVLVSSHRQAQYLSDRIALAGRYADLAPFTHFHVLDLKAGADMLASYDGLEAYAAPGLLKASSRAKAYRERAAAAEAAEAAEAAAAEVERAAKVARDREAEERTRAVRQAIPFPFGPMSFGNAHNVAPGTGART